MAVRADDNDTDYKGDITYDWSQFGDLDDLWLQKYQPFCFAVKQCNKIGFYL